MRTRCPGAPGCNRDVSYGRQIPSVSYCSIGGPPPKVVNFPSHLCMHHLARFRVFLGGL